MNNSNYTDRIKICRSIILDNQSYKEISKGKPDLVFHVINNDTETELFMFNLTWFDLERYEHNKQYLVEYHFGKHQKNTSVWVIQRFLPFVGEYYYTDGQAQLALNNYNHYLETGDVPDEVEL